MRLDIVSCQPRMFEGFLSESIVARAVKKNLCQINVVDLREFGEGNYKKIDDKPYGGGPGMLMKCGPWFAAIEKLAAGSSAKPRIIMTSPAARHFTQADAEELAKCEHVIFMCGHYEGFDERIRTLATDEFSVGDFVMTGGELAAAAMTDSIVRLIPGVLGGGMEATTSESFSCGSDLLEAPQYTHPADFRGMKVPDVLLSGDHAKIDAWRKSAAQEKTREIKGTNNAADIASSSISAPFRFSRFDEYFMKMALREAEKAAEDGEVPTGCIIVEEPESLDDMPSSARILARAHNQTEDLEDATAHAEILALSAAFQAKGNWRLSGTRMYVTKEPCPMCAGAIVLARIPTVIWGVSDPKRGGGTTFGIFEHPGINHHPNIISGVLEEPCKQILKDFFQKRRKEKES